MLGMVAAWGMSLAQTPTYTFQVNLTINNTDNTVYIPGVGEGLSLGLPAATYTSPPSRYLASYLNDELKGLVYSQQTFQFLAVSSETGEHTFSLGQNLTNSQIFVVFSKGDYQKIDTQMDRIEESTFLEGISPSFAYGQGIIHPIKFVLNYPSIDLQGNYIFHRGIHEISLESNKSSNNQVLVITENVPV